MVLIMILQTLFALVLLTASAGAATYFVDAASGNDANSGTSEAAAWRSLGPVNAAVFAPGDSIHFRSGGVWDGQLAPRGSGAPGRPISIGVYGGDKPAVIQGPGTPGSAALALVDQSYWEVRQLEFTNQQPAGGQNGLTGISIRSRGKTLQQHIYIERCVVRDVNSPAVTKANYNAGKSTGGIIFRGDISDVRVVRCHIHDVGVEGLRTSSTRAVKDVVFTDNLIENVSGDGIVIHGSGSGSHIARNVVRNVCMSDGGNFAGIWTYDSHQTIVEYNEVSGLKGGGTADGQAFDADSETDGDVFQYNYTHDNARGFMLFMASARNIIVRYNISENDAIGSSPMRGGHRLIAQNAGKGSATNQVYNNVFYSRTPLDTVFNTCSAITFRNNIILLEGGTRQFNTQPFGPGAVFDHNCYFPATIVAQNGPPVGSTDILGDPRLSQPGAGGVGVELKADGFAAGQRAYWLRADSPLLGAGASITAPRLRDYWGTFVGSRSNIGADQATGH